MGDVAEGRVAAGKSGAGKAPGKRQLRHQAIREVIRGNEVRTQRDLAELLQQQGFDCTQATVSRDIVEMNLRKTAGGIYVLPEEERLMRLAVELVTDVKVGGTMAVVKTLPGGAQGLCAALDDAQLPGALGTVAGDDTIMVACIDEAAAQGIAEEISRLRR